MNHFLKSSLILSLLALIFFSCEKDPGEGGNSTITGKIYVREYNKDFTELKAEYYAPDEDIFIIYGTGTVANNDMKTGPDGDYMFQYLRPGTYMLYAYSADSAGTSQSGMIPIYREVEITEKNQTIDAGTIIILKN
jgi:hypothetical protein